MRVRLAWLAFTLGGCFGPDLGHQPFLCGEPPAECPPGYACGGPNICIRVGADAGGRADAGGPADAEAADGAKCEPNAFVECSDKDNAKVCNESGDGTFKVPCEAGCDEVLGQCNHCAPDQPACLGDDLILCGSDGNPAVTTPCPLGCDDATGAARCRVLVPSNLTDASICDTPGGTALDVTLSKVVDTGACEGGQIVPQPGSLVCMIRLSDFTVETGVLVQVEGDKPLVIVADNVTILGGILAGGHGMLDGPAGVTTSGGNTSDSYSSGGGGGGNLGLGAPGGPFNPELFQSGGAGGPAQGTPENVPLVGGSRGGTGGQPPCVTILRALCPAATPGGGAGGAIQLSACQSLVFGSESFIDAGGGGGPGGQGTILTQGFGGGGGGSGGAILVEAPRIQVPAGVAVTANGGGGGAGGTQSGGPGTGPPGGNGENGRPAASAAAGGVPGSDEAGPGGPGGTGNDAARSPISGGPPAIVGSGAGGGGGAAGHIRFNVRVATTPEVDPDAVVSPPSTSGAVLSH